MLLQYCKNYKSVDFKKTNEKLDYVADAQDMKKVIKDNQFDTVFCSQVLEHVPEPQKVFNEIHRILKKDGHVIFTVPFLGYLHNEPYDFFRYTKHSLKFMTQKSNLEIAEIKESGGLFSFLGYIWSTSFVGLFSGFPVLNKIVFYINIPICYIWIFLDKITMNKKIMPLNYLLVLKRVK
jgi:SAM-dependent methyltransferase